MKTNELPGWMDPDFKYRQSHETNILNTFVKHGLKIKDELLSQHRTREVSYDELMRLRRLRTDLDRYGKLTKDGHVAFDLEVFERIIKESDGF